MKVYREVSPYEFLMHDSWECENLKDAVKTHEVTKEQFDSVMEDVFNESDGVSMTQLNDFFRFGYDAILPAFGIEDDE